MDTRKSKVREFWSTAFGRMAVTGLLVAVSFSLRWLPAPGLNLESAGAYWGFPTHPLSVGSLGLAPFILGYLVVELAAALVPRWRSLRTSGRQGRRVLHQASGFVGVGLAAVLAVAAGVYWYDLVGAYLGPGGLGLHGGVWNRVVLGASLVGGTSALYLLASLITRFGLGNGFSVIIAGGLLWEMVPASEAFIEWIQSMNAHNLDVFGVFGNSLAVALVILGTLWMLVRAPRRTGLRETGADGADQHDASELGETRWWPLPGVTSSILPLAVAVWLVDVGRQLYARFAEVSPHLWMAGARETVLSTSLVFMAAKVGIVLVGAVLLARWFYPLDAMVAAWTKAGGGRDEAVRGWLRRRRRLGMLFSAGFLIGVLLLGAYGGELIRSVGAVNIVIVTAIVADLVREWRFRQAHDAAVSVEEVHRLWMLPVKLAQLHRRGIEATARGRCHRGLFHAFAPFVPVELLVPRGEQRAARDAVASEESE